MIGKATSDFYEIALASLEPTLRVYWLILLKGKLDFPVNWRLHPTIYYRESVVQERLHQLTSKIYMIFQQFIDSALSPNSMSLQSHNTSNVLSLPNSGLLCGCMCKLCIVHRSSHPTDRLCLNRSRERLLDLGVLFDIDRTIIADAMKKSRSLEESRTFSLAVVLANFMLLAGFIPRSAKALLNKQEGRISHDG